jgi:uncharacterized membrane protein
MDRDASIARPIRVGPVHRLAFVLWTVAVMLPSWLGATEARADLQLCNGTTGRVGVAIGYKDSDGAWVTEGWWNLPPHACEAVLKGALAARFYYVYAIDYDKGGEWAGQAYMCTREKEFTIRGIDNCLARGFDRTGFYEVDTGQQRSWTVQFTEASQQPQNPPVGEATVPIPPGRQGPPVGPLPGTQNR